MRTVKGPIAEAKSCAQETQRFTRQIESVRSEALAVGERQDIGPKADVRRQTPGQRPGKKDPGFRAQSNLSRVGAMIPKDGSCRQPACSETNPWAKSSGSYAQG
jgi:hypothetical protein